MLEREREREIHTPMSAVQVMLGRQTDRQRDTRRDPQSARCREMGKGNGGSRILPTNEPTSGTS